MENILFGVVIGMITTAVFIFLTQKVYADKKAKEKVVNKLPVDINDFDLPTALPMLRHFKVKRSTEQVGNVITVTWKYKSARSYRSFLVDEDKYLAENQAAFKQFCREQEFGFYMRNSNLFPLVKGKKK